MFGDGAPGLAPLTLDAAAMRKVVLGNVSLRGFAFARHVDRDTLRADLQSLFALCVDGHLRITTTRFALDEAPAAHRAIQERDTLGKVVLLNRSEEHTSELQSLMRSSYAVFCLKQKKTTTKDYRPHCTI